VVDCGEIVERGTHEELLAAEGRYKQLYDNATIAGNKVTSPVASAAAADVAKGVVSAANDSDIANPSAGQLYFNTSSNIFRQYDGTAWKTVVDADLLSNVGTLNASTNPVDWTKLKNVPANVASGYSAGTGININGNNISN